MSNGPSETKMSPQEAQQIIQAFGKALESPRPTDASELPYPKQRIKDALLMAISSTQDKEARDQLKTAYISLADWQEGIGKNPYALLDQKGIAPQELATQIVAAGRSFAEIPNRVVAEAQALMGELKARGL